MSTLIGGKFTTNFSTPQTFEYAPNTSSSTEPDPLPTMEELRIEEIVLRKIASLNKNQAEVNLNLDKNPLDNIIRNEVVALFGYRKLSHSDIQRALDLYALGQDPSHDMSMVEHKILLDQAREMEALTEDQYLSIVKEPNMFWFTYPEQYLKILQFQLNLPSVIPTMEELQAAGIVEFIIKTVKENPEGLIKETTIQYYTEKYINELLLRSEFIGYDKAQAIYKDPAFLMNILDKITLQKFFYRLKPYLTFITDDKITQINDWLPSSYKNITDLFSVSQIRLMVDKELDIKNTILKTLTLDEVTRTFNALAEGFKLDFTSAFTNEKLMELIQLTINSLYPVPTTEEIYQELATVYGITISTEKINQIETYLNSY